MRNLLKDWEELKNRILTSEENNKKYVLNFWEKENIVKPYSKLVYGNISCDFTISRHFIGFDCYDRIDVNMKDLVYGI